MPEISIIVPVYNVEGYLEKCVESLRNQTFEDIEILLIDDGSTDHSGSMCDRLEQTDKRIRSFHKENGGVASARNFGMKKAAGEFLMFVDSDDWINHDTCKETIHIAREYSTDVVMWSYIREYPGKSFHKRINLEERLYTGEDVTSYIRRRMVGLCGKELKNPENADALSPCWGKLYRRELIADGSIEFVDQQLIGPTEDALFNLELFARVKRFYFLNRPLYHYKKTQNTSITTIYKSWLFDRWQLLYQKMTEVIDQQDLGSGFRRALDNRICLSMIGLGLNEINPTNPKKLPGKIRCLKRILREPHYRNAYSRLQLKHFPIHWKVFLYLCKIRFGIGIIFILKVMRYSQSRV